MNYLLLNKKHKSEMKNFQEKEIAFIIYKLTIVSLFVLQSKD